MINKELEQTLVLIKPDALKNSLTGYVLSRFSEFHTGLRFAAAKVVHVTKMLAEEHYAEHRGKIFFPALIEYIMGDLHYPGKPDKQRVIALVYQGPNAVDIVRQIVGPTNPHAARDQKPGSIRSLGAVVPLYDENKKVIGERMDNLIHASATIPEAEREIKLWFQPSDIPPAVRIYPTAQSEAHYYYKDGHLLTAYEKGSFGLITPGQVAWESDYKALELISRGKASDITLEYVASKYLVNDERFRG